jgi:hypothetical protein
MTSSPASMVSPSVKVLETALAVQKQEHDGEVRVLREGMEDLRLAIEDRGWLQVGNSYIGSGLELQSLRIVSASLRSWLVAGSLIKRITELRGNTIYGDGVGFKGYGKAKAPFEKSQNNQDMLFSSDALMDINRAHCTDGTIVFLVNNNTKEIERFVLERMGQPFVNSANPEIIWFVRRSYNLISTADPTGKLVDEYIPTDICPQSEQGLEGIIEKTGSPIPVNYDYTAVVWRVNSQIGWPFGIPDLMPALQWAEKYTDYLKDQAKFAKAIAQIAWQMKAQTPDQLTKLSAALRPDGVADSIGMTPGMDMKPMAGGSSITMEGGKALAAQAAAAGEVTVEDALAERDSTAAGSSLDPTVLDMATSRRNSATNFFKRIGKLLGAPNLEVIWPDLQSESPFREAQMIIAAWGTGNFYPEETRPALAQRLRIPLTQDAPPADVIIPGTQAAIKASAPPALPAPGAKPAASDAAQNTQGVDALGVGKASAGTHTSRDKGETPK